MVNGKQKNVNQSKDTIHQKIFWGNYIPITATSVTPPQIALKRYALPAHIHNTVKARIPYRHDISSGSLSKDSNVRKPVNSEIDLINRLKKPKNKVNIA